MTTPYDWEKDIEPYDYEPRPSTWDVPSPLNQKKPGYEYPANYTGSEAPALTLNPWKGDQTPTNGGTTSPTRWTVPSRLAGTTTTPIKPGIPLPKFTLPERDEGRVKELRTEALSTPMRSMRQEARRGLSRIGSMEGPMAKEAYRGWTEGLGTGISSIASQASLQAEQLYGVERGEEINAMLTNFQAEMNEYMASWGTTTTYDYGGSGSGSDYYQYPGGNRMRKPSYLRKNKDFFPTRG